MQSIIEPVEENVRTLIDISEISINVQTYKIFYHIKTPLLENIEWRIKRLYPIPRMYGKIFAAPIIEHDVILQTPHDYIPVDTTYLLKKCKLNGAIPICKRTSPNLVFLHTSSCESEMLKQSNNKSPCSTALFKVKEITYIPLEQVGNYIIIPENTIEVNLLCNNQTVTKISTPTLFRTSDDCVILTANTIMKLGGTNKQLTYETRLKPLDFNFSFEQIDLIYEQVRRAPLTINTFSEYKTNLDEITQKLQSIENTRRNKTWKETTMSILQTAGYIALGLITLYTLIKLFRCNPTGNVLLFCKNCYNNNSNANTEVSEVRTLEANAPAPYNSSPPPSHNIPPQFRLQDIDDTEFDTAPVRRKRVRFGATKV